MKTQKITTKIKSAISIATAAVILSATAFANGILPDFPAGDYTVNVFSGSEKIELSNAPFVKDGEVYIPLRAFLEKCSPETEIIWQNDGSITLNTSYSFIYEPFTEKAVSAALKINSSEICFDSSLQGVSSQKFILEHTPLLIKGKTYIPYCAAILLDREASVTNGFELIINTNDNSEKMSEAARIWANSLVTRDGLPRFEMMTEALQNDFIAEKKGISGNDEINYVIGYSSPKICSYDIVVYGNSAYITYLQADNTDERYSASETITFEEADGKILVSSATETYADF